MSGDGGGVSWSQINKTTAKKAYATPDIYPRRCRHFELESHTGKEATVEGGVPLPPPPQVHTITRKHGLQIAEVFLVETQPFLKVLDNDQRRSGDRQRYVCCHSLHVFTITAFRPS